MSKPTIHFEFPDDVTDENAFAVVQAFKDLLNALQPGVGDAFQIQSFDRDPARSPRLDHVKINIDLDGAP